MAIQGKPTTKHNKHTSIIVFLFISAAPHYASRSCGCGNGRGCGMSLCLVGTGIDKALNTDSM